jgi:N-acetylglucosaminyl-diphospho-decaprenol L-rhamnosyltransferase
MSNQSKIYLIIVTYNAEAWIESCLNSVLLSSFEMEVIVIDNNSTDSTTQIIQAQFPKVDLITNCKNVGFGKANNIGIQIALDNKAEYVFLLNQDAKIDVSCVSDLIKIGDNFPEYAILSPMHLNYEGDSIDPHFVGYLTQGTSEIISDFFLGRVKQIYDVPFTPAAGWLLRSSAVREVGIFDPIFFMYGEDYDLALRMRRLGYKMGLVPEANICHWHGGFPEKKSFRKRIWNDYWQVIVSLKNPDATFWFTLIKLARGEIISLLINILCLNIEMICRRICVCFQIIPKLAIINSHRQKCLTNSGAFINNSDTSNLKHKFLSGREKS